MKILLADDHALFRDGIRYVLQQLAEGVDLLEAGDFRQAMSLADQHPELDLALLDLHMPGSYGVSSVDEFHQHYPHIPVVVVSADVASANMEKAMNYGAVGFVSKNSSAQVMLGALKLVLSGGVYVPPEILRRNLGDAGVKPHGLTPRQHEVLQYLCAGLSNKEIAARIRLAEGTVKIHVAAVYQALNVNSRLEAVRAAEYLGLVEVAHG